MAKCSFIDELNSYYMPKCNEILLIIEDNC